MKTVIALLFALVVVDQASAQTAQLTPGANITNTEIQAAICSDLHPWRAAKWWPLSTEAP
jgi:hypothetical protein